MTTDEYVPSEEQMRHAYWLTRMLDHHAAVTAAFDRFIARVRRDAAREALDGLAANMTQIANKSPDALTRTSATITARLAGEYKASVYPEETP